jgi:hypothetical protein
MIVGLALSKSKAAIPNAKQSTIDPETEIFHENPRLQRNTVNDCFPRCPASLLKAACSKPLHPVLLTAFAIRLMAKAVDARLRIWSAFRLA